MKITTWNINSVRARLAILLEFLRIEQPDIVLLQELKCLSEAFPSEEIEDLGYNLAIQGQKTYNGVAILAKSPLSDIVTNFPENPIPDEARYIEATVNLTSFALRVASVYVPNGQSIDSSKYPVKLEFLKQLHLHYRDLKAEALVIAGDFNVALTDLDIFDADLFKDSILFSLAERKALRQFINHGLIDQYRLKKFDEGFTWWDYRAGSYHKDHGARIDYIFCSPEAAEYNVDCYVEKKWRSKDKASDHAPLTALFNFKPRN